jgi:hypothetical protein
MLKVMKGQRILTALKNNSPGIVNPGCLNYRYVK